MSFNNTSLPFPFTEELVRAQRRRRSSQAPASTIQQQEPKEQDIQTRELTQREKEQDVLDRLRPVPPSLRRSRVTRQQFEAQERLRASIRSSNLRLLKSIGVRPQPVGTIQRTAADILSGKRDAPLNQVTASVRRQVELERINKALGSGKLKVTASELAQIRSGVNETFREGQAEERQFRNVRSTNKARGEAAVFEANRLQELDSLQKANRQSAIISTGRQNQKVLSTLDGLGVSDDLTRATPRRTSRVGPVSNPSQRDFALQQVNRPITESRNVLTSGQINSLDPEARVSRRDSVLNDFFTPNPQSNQSDNILSGNEGGIVDLGLDQNIQRPVQNLPSNEINTVIPSLRSNVFGFSLTGKFPSGGQQDLVEGEPEPLSFTGTREDFFRQRVIDNTTKGISEFGDKVSDPISKFATGVAEETIGIGTSLANLGRQGLNTFSEVVTGKKRPAEPQFFVAPTVTGEATSGIIEGGSKAFQTGDARDFFGGVSEGLSRADKLRKEQGDARTVGQIFAFAAPTAPAVGRVSPVRSNPIILPLTSGEKKVATTITAFGRPVATKQGKSISRGGVKTERLDLENISPIDRGFEIGTGTTKAAQRAKESIVDELGRRGLLSEQDVSKVKTVREIVEIGSQAPRKVFRDNFGNNPFVELKPGKQTEAQLDFFRRESLPPITGSFSQIPQILPQFARRAGDFDIKIGDVQRGAQLARRNADILNPTASPLEQFVAVKAKVKKVTPQGETKVGEFLTKDDELIGDGQGLTLDSVFGINPNKKPVKVTGIEVTTLRDQLLRKASTVSALQGPQSKGVRKDALSVGPPDFRQKDITDLFAIGKTQAFVLRESGKKTKAKKLDEASERLKDLFPDVDFDAPFTRGETVEFGIREPSILSSFISKTPKKGPATSSLPRIQSEASSISVFPNEPKSIPLSRLSIPDSLSSRSSRSRGSSTSKSNVSSIQSFIPSNIRIGRSSRSKSSRTSNTNKSKSNVSSIQSLLPSNISIGDSLVSKSNLSRSQSSKSNTSKSQSTSRSGSRSGFTRSPTTTFGDPTSFSDPSIKLGLFNLKLKDEAKLEDERVTGIGRKQFRTGTADPLAPGVIAAFDVRERKSRSAKVFRRLDKALVRSREKRSKFGVFDPNNPFGTDIKF